MTKLTFKEQMRGFPVWKIVVICIIRFAEPIAFTSLFPYVYFMVRDFGIAKDPADISKYVGYLSSSFAFCQFLCSIHWGHLSDMIGRKKVLMTGLILTGISMLIFGFSKNYYMALFARSMMGAVNGNVAVIRTVLGEIATEKRHQAIAFSTMPLLWQVGCIIGPMSGYLVKNDVEKKISKRSFDLLEKYPYALSNIVVAIGLFLSATICFLFFEETHYQKKFQKDYGVELGDILLRKLGFQPSIRPWQPAYTAQQQQQQQVPAGRRPSLLVRNSNTNGDSIARTISSTLDNYNGSGSLPQTIKRVPATHRDSITRNIGSLGRGSSFGVNVGKTSLEARETTPLLEQEEQEDQGRLEHRESDRERERECDREHQTFDIDDDEDATTMGSSDADSIASTDSADSVHSIGPLSRRQSLALIRTYSLQSNALKEELEENRGTYEWKVLLSPSVFKAISSNFMLSLHGTVVDEFLPVFLASKTARIVNGDLSSPLLSKFPFKIMGGLSFNPTDVGNLLTVTGTIGVMIVIFLYPYLDRNYAPVATYRAVSCIPPFVYLFIPFLVFTLPPNLPSLAYTKAFLYILAFFKVLPNSICFPQIMLLIHRASPAKNRAFVNGTTLSVCALARCVAPMVWGYVMSWSDEHQVSWVTWWSLSGIAICALVPAFLMNEIDDEEDSTRQRSTV
ncbi:hypothetical protein PACTADRAFT_51837 [Pachysolen tannophilus NRRL Y-2460]|uniref:Major facilitator superfamily (MFS) profile domain-containing protein n=1 Tax=Pachysolen tannophilus NRRL Y-2460 TaxID=669874 RepID=A0A1E4TNH1_PACTA|nr:hypothetical protein PACTADRAFT_51837 [Pachysolen tannophilus NRRL Y-2460]